MLILLNTLKSWQSPVGSRQFAVCSLQFEVGSWQSPVAS